MTDQTRRGVVEFKLKRTRPNEEDDGTIPLRTGGDAFTQKSRLGKKEKGSGLSCVRETRPESTYEKDVYGQSCRVFTARSESHSFKGGKEATGHCGEARARVEKGSVSRHHFGKNPREKGESVSEQ